MAAATGSRSQLRVLVALPDPSSPGGITAVVASWKRAGLGDAVTLVELPTSAMERPLPVKLAQALVAVLRLAGMLIRPSRRPDVVHLNSSIGGSLWRKLALSWCCRLARVPYVAQMHSGRFEQWLTASALNRTAARALFGGAAITIVLGRRWEGAVRELGARDVVVLPNAISEPERRRLAAIDRRPAAAGPVVLLHYGRWAPVKGADLLADALRELGRDDYEVRVFGSGDRRWLESMFEGLAGRVTIGSWLEGEEKPAELAAADALIAPSRAEGLPTALLEARAASLPVIATDVGAVAEALAGYRLARLVDPGEGAGLREALEQLLDRRWPEPANGPEPTAELPAELRSEYAVERLLELYGRAAGGG